jgi:hypothetical protein
MTIKDPQTHKNTSRYKCPCFGTTSGTTKNANVFSGSHNKPQHLVSDSFLYSTLVNNSRYQNGGKVTFQNMSKEINAFGRWPGAPGGSGRPPTNQF